jgi:hypothetical protein
MTLDEYRDHVRARRATRNHGSRGKPPTGKDHYGETRTTRETGTRLISEGRITGTLSRGHIDTAYVTSVGRLLADRQEWPATAVDEDLAGRCADARARSGTRGTIRCRHIVYCDAMRDLQRPGRVMFRLLAPTRIAGASRCQPGTQRECHLAIDRGHWRTP